MTRRPQTPTQKRRARNLLLLRKYGITLRQYNLMLKLQGGRCLLCGKKPKGHTLNVDHDHTTKRVRGLLDFWCNKFYVAKNTVETAEQVVKYLRSNFDGRAL